MKNVEIYDQYSDVYLDTQTNDLIVLKYNQEIDKSRYTLVHPSSGFTLIKGEKLDLSQAINLVESIYLESQNLGQSYEDFKIDLNNGYAELLIFFEDGKKLNRVIYIKDNL